MGKAEQAGEIEDPCHVRIMHSHFVFCDEGHMTASYQVANFFEKRYQKDMENIILTSQAQTFIDSLHRKFNGRRLALLKERATSGPFHFLEETKNMREDNRWHAAEVPDDLKVRTVEITGPVERKMMINAFNSGADLFMADFEDALSPTWENVINGQQNLMEAVRKTLRFTSPEGKAYVLKDKIATLAVRPRGWHLPEKHYQVDGESISGSLFDFGLYFFHNAQELLKRGTGPYFYLPKLESYHEAELWSEVFSFAEESLNIPQGSIKATVLIETLPAAFQMEEILYALRKYIVGLNAGRWDYIFSIIKKYAEKKELLLPDRGEITMAVPFMSSYANLLVQTCLKRKAQPIGGMSAFIPSRKDPELNERALKKVREDKKREAGQGYIGTWVAHPDLVQVAREAFLQGTAHPVMKKVSEEDLQDFRVPGGKITSEGVKQNVEVALEYFEAWFSGTGAAAIHNLMEDAATAEISRAQLWQWVHHGAIPIEQVWAEMEQKGSERSRVLLKTLVQSKTFIPFFTTEAYKQL